MNSVEISNPSNNFQARASQEIKTIADSSIMEIHREAIFPLQDQAGL